MNHCLLKHLNVFYHYHTIHMCVITVAAKTLLCLFFKMGCCTDVMINNVIKTTDR